MCVSCCVTAAARISCDSKMAAVRLTYFDGRGLAEGIRFVLGALGVDFEDVHLTTRQEMLDLIASGKLMFAQVQWLKMAGLVSRGPTGALSDADRAVLPVAAA